MGEEDHRKQMAGSELRDQELERRPGEEHEGEAKKAAPGETELGGGAGAEAASCDYCGGAAAAVYCRADSARLCLPCDRHVHGANGVCSRHARAPLCADCRAAAAVFRRAASATLFLCSNCDFGRHRDGCGGGEPALHDRCAVQPYSGCPPATELAAILGVPLFDKPAADDGGGWWDIWEEPQVLSLEDLIVPTTPCHGFQPLLTPSSPKKNRGISADEKMNKEILRQLGELAESDGGVQAAVGHEEAEQAADQLPSWAPPPQYTTGHGNFGAENNHEVATMPTPGFENGSWNNGDYVLSDACKVELSYDQAPVSSAEACLSSFVPMSEICPSMSNGSSMEENHQANPGLDTPMQGFPKRTGFDVVPCPDRGSVISRYKEKRKTRRFDRQVRYESRKVRADGRLRIKGRFAKANQT
ncbi:unnamed protein product [Urochloa decumbens]|uniref:Uncharacterized protein n=1 Tax=Urochloa decumbens TaxID=240449 RepID=A0ABC8XB27_9POAL